MQVTLIAISEDLVRIDDRASPGAFHILRASRLADVAAMLISSGE